MTEDEKNTEVKETSNETTQGTSANNTEAVLTTSEQASPAEQTSSVEKDGSEETSQASPIENGDSEETSHNLPAHHEGGFLAERPQIVYKLSDFEGPIELLYELIKAARIPIEDIFISEITNQYVQILRDTPKEELDYDYAGDFISMAADLIYLKSVHTLPKDDEGEEVDDAEAERERLIAKIKEYAYIREQSDKLREIETINRFYREPVFTDKDYRVALVNFSLPKLVEAFARVLANADKRSKEIIPKKVMKDRFSVHEQMTHISMMIAVRREMKFTDLFEPDYDKSDIVTTFLAVLELLKYGRLTAKQEVVFGEITIYAIEGMEDVPIEFEEGDDGKY